MVCKPGEYFNLKWLSKVGFISTVHFDYFLHWWGNCTLESSLANCTCFHISCTTVKPLQFWDPLLRSHPPSSKSQLSSSKSCRRQVETWLRWPPSRHPYEDYVASPLETISRHIIDKNMTRNSQYLLTKGKKKCSWPTWSLSMMK